MTLTKLNLILQTPNPEPLKPPKQLSRKSKPWPETYKDLGKVPKTLRKLTMYALGVQIRDLCLMIVVV